MMMDAISKKKYGNRSVNWTEREKVLLVQSVLEKEDELFATVKGRGNSSKEVVTRHKAWMQLQDFLNSELDVPRTVDQMKKAFENIKSRAKLKVELIKDSNGSVSYHYVNTTPSIQLLIDRLCGITTEQHDRENAEVTEFKPRIYSFGSIGTDDETSSLEHPHHVADQSDHDLVIGPLTDDSSEPLSTDHGQTRNPHSTTATTHATPHSPNDKRKQLEDEMLELKVKKARAKVEQINAKTQLVYKRQEQEHELFLARKRQEEELFELKKKLINTKIKHLSERDNGD